MRAAKNRQFNNEVNGFYVLGSLMQTLGMFLDSFCCMFMGSLLKW